MKKSTIILLIFLIMIMCVSAVSAADDASDDLAASEEDAVSVSNDDIVSASDSNTVLATDDNLPNFEKLNGNITGAQSGYVKLSSNFKRNASDSNDPITIGSDIEIEGDGNTIDGNGYPIFTIATGAKVTLKNIILKNATDAILNNGELTLNGVTFTGCKVTSNSNLTLTSCTFDDDEIVLNTGAKLLSKADVIVKASPETIDVSTITTSTVSSTISAEVYINENKKKIVVNDGWTYNDGTKDFTGDFETSKLGTYQINATNLAIVNAVYTNATVTVNAGKSLTSDIHIVSNTTNPVYNDNIAFNVTIDKKTAGSFEATPSGQIYYEISMGGNIIASGYKDLVDGNATIIWKATETGDHRLYVTYAGDENFAAGAGNDYPNIGAKTPEIIITVDNSTKFGEQTIDITMPSDVPGTITVKVNGTEFESQSLTEGKATFKVNKVVGKNYEVIVEYTGEPGNYVATAASSTFFDVNKVNTPLTISGNNVTQGTNLTFTIQLADDINDENVTIDVTGIPQFNKTLTNGFVSVDLGPVTAKEYTITVNYAGNDVKYAAATNTTTLKVSGVAPEIVITTGDAVLFEDVAVTVNITNKHNLTNPGTVKIFVNGVEYGVADYNQTTGLFNYTIKSISVGEKNITANFTASDDEAKYLANGNNTKKVTVDQLTPEITVDVGKVELGQSFTAKINLTNNGTSNAPTGIVVLEVDGYPLGNRPLTSGATEREITPTEAALTAGEHTIYVTYNGDKNYTQATKEYKFNVDKHNVYIAIEVAPETEVISNVTINVTVTSGYSFAGNLTIVIKNSAGTTVHTDTIHFIEGTKQTVLDTKLPLGNYTVEVSYNNAESPAFNTNSTSAKFNVTKAQPTVTATVFNNNINYPTQAIVNITSNAKGKYTIYANGTKVAEGTIDAGVVTNATLDVLTVGNYEINVTYVDEDNVYATKTVTAPTNLVVNNGTIEKLNVTVSAVDYPAQAIVYVNASVNGNYYVTVNNKNYTVVVANGVGNVTIDLLDVADYTVNVTSNVTYYDVQTNHTTLVVNNGTIASLNVTVENVVFGNNATVYISASKDGRYNVTIDGDTTIYTIDVVNGEGNVTVGKYNVGTYLVTVKSNVTNYNTKVNNTVSYNVTNATIDVNVTVDNVVYPAQAVVYVNATVSGTYNITVDGGSTIIPVEVTTLKDGIYTGNKTLDILAAGDHYVNVTATIPNYNVVNEKAEFTVEKGTILFNFTAINAVDYPNPVTITFNTNVKGINATQGKGYLIALYDNATGNLIKEIKHADDTGAIDLGVLAPGTYKLRATAIAGDEGFANYTVAADNTTYNETEFTVNPGTIGVTVEVVGTVKYPDNATIKVTANVTDTYIVKVNGEEYSVFVNASVGSNTTTIKLLDVGKYTVNVTSTNANYTKATNDTALEVVNGTIGVSISVDNVNYPAIPVATVTANVTGTYTIIVNGKEYTVDINVTKSNTEKVVLDKGALYYSATPYYANISATIKNYEAVKNTTTFTVGSGAINLTITVANVVYGNKPVANVSANVTGKYNVTFKGKDYIVNITSENGAMAYATVELDEILAVGSYDQVKVESMDGNYTAVYNETSFRVTQADPVILITVKNAKFNENCTVYVEIENATNGIVNFYNNGKPLKQDVSLTNGKANYTFEYIAVGYYNIEVQFRGDTNLTNANNYTGFQVEQAQSNLTVDGGNCVYNETSVINITVTPNNGTAWEANGNVVITGDLSHAAVALLPGAKVSIDFGKLAAGTYNINITYYGNKNYTAVYDKAYTFTVQKATPVITVSANNATYPNNVTVDFTNNVAGNLTIIYAGKDGSQEYDLGVVEAGSWTYNLTGLYAGDYTVYLKYNEGQNYTAVTVNDTFTVKQSTPVISAIVVPATYPDAAVVNVTSNIDGTYTITVLDAENNTVLTKTGDFIAGEYVNVTLDVIAAGNYKVNVTYDENVNYTSVTEQYNLVISKGTPVISIVTVNAIFPNRALVNFTSDVEGDFNFTIGDVVGNGTFVNGKLTIELPFVGAVGTYPVTLTYKENENYTSVPETGSLTIEKGTAEINITVDTITALEDATLTINIPYATGNFTLYGTSLPTTGIVIELTDGVATYNIGKLNPGNYSYVVEYSGDHNLSGDVEAFTFTVDRLDPNLQITSAHYTWGEKGVVNITIDNKDELTVSISIDGKVVEEFFKVTNGSAQYALPELAVGKYDIIVSYAGSEMYNASSQIIENLTVSQLTPTIVVPDVTLTYPETGSFVISTNVANMELRVKIGDEDPILVTTDENGNATANIKLVFEAGNYTISVSNVANVNISAVTSNATLTVNKANINLTVTGPVNVTYPENVTFTIKTDVAGNYTIDINGKSKVYEIAAGESIISGLANVGDCTIVVTSADPNYETATATFTTTVLPGTADITIDAPASAFDKEHIITITTTVAGKYLINVDGKETNATIDNGESGYYTYVVPQTSLPQVLLAGNYTITVTSLDPNYKASANATLVVTKAAAKVNITDNADEIMVGDDFTFTVTMSDDFANGNVTIYVDGKENQTVLLDYAYANATVTISGLTAYYHVIGVKYNGNNNYNPSENTTVDVDVYKYTPVITVSVENATSLVAIAATEATITVTGVKGKATGEITVDYENGTSVTYNLTDGVYVLELYDLTAGTYSIPVYYLGDDIYSYEYTDINFTVTQGSATPVISEVTTPIKYGDDATFTVTLDNTFGPTGNVTITVNNVEVQTVVLDDNCSATVTLTGLTPNTYTIGVKYNGDINFKPSEEVKTTILVEKATPAIAIAFADENLTAIAGTTITVTVADGKATGTVKVTAAGFTKEETLENGTITLEIYDVVAGDYTVEVTYYGDDNYVKSTANKTFTVAKRDVTPVISEPTSVILVGQNATFIVTMDQNFANGNITVYVDNGKYVDLALDDQYANVSVYIPGLAAGTHVIGVKYNGNENCNPSEEVNTTIVVNKNDVSKLIAVSTVDGVYNTSSAKVIIELPGDAKGNVTISIVGLDNITAEIAGNTIVDMDIELPAGTYGLVQVVYSGDDKYLPYTTQGLLPEFVVNKANATVSIGDIAAATYPGSVNITYAVTPAFLNATVTVTDAKGNVVKSTVADNKVILTDLAAGAYTITVFTPGDNNFNNATASKTFSVAKADPTFTTVAAVNVTVGQNMTITVIAPEDATGTVYATVSGELVATGIPLVNGTATIVVPNLAYGKYGYAVTYEGDNNYNLATDINSFEIIKNDVSGNVTIDIPAGSSTYEPTFGISNLPSDAQGTLTVTVDGKEYVTNVKNGAASITIPGLSAGNHNVTITYSGDGQYGNITKSDMITLIAPVAKLAGSDLKVLFSGSAKYVVVLTIDGKPAAGEIVSVSFNGAKLSAKTNSKGEATFKLNSKAKIDTYDVKAKYGSVETTNKVTIKNIIKAKNKKVKKSKTTKVKITLSKVDGKYLKGKKLKIKLKGKKYKVKTNKKGKATWKVKPSMIKKLKVGKKYKYTVSYGKDTVTKKLKIKR